MPPPRLLQVDPREAEKPTQWGRAGGRQPTPQRGREGAQGGRPQALEAEARGCPERRAFSPQRRDFGPKRSNCSLRYEGCRGGSWGQRTESGGKMPEHGAEERAEAGEMWPPPLGPFARMIAKRGGLEGERSVGGWPKKPREARPSLFLASDQATGALKPVARSNDAGAGGREPFL